MKSRFHIITQLLCLWLFFGYSTKHTAQISIPNAAFTDAQDFNSLASAGTSSTVPAGWAFVEASTNANALYTAGTGSSNAGDTYSFGLAANSERAFGGLQSGTLIPTVGVCYTNNTGGIITGFTITYTGETWRVGAASRTDGIQFQYNQSTTAINGAGTWTSFPALDYFNPGQAATGSGTLQHSALITSPVAGLSIQPGATFCFRWNDFNATGADDGMAVDDYSLSNITVLPTCEVIGYTFNNISSCNNNGTPGNPADDYFTTDVDVIYSNSTIGDSLILTGGDLVFRRTMLALVGTNVTSTFTTVRFRADGAAVDFTGQIGIASNIKCSLPGTGPAVNSCSSGPTTPVVITCAPQTTPVNCPAPPVFTAPTATGGCTAAAPVITFVDAFVAGCAGSGTHTRTWTATDACGNTATCSRSIVVQDVTPPIITCAAQTSPVNCPAAPVFVAPTATDACSTVPPVITFVDAFVAGCGGSGTHTRTWTATDACGNTATCSRSIVVQDVTPPIITCAAQTSPVNCPAAPVFVAPTATDACSTVPPVITFVDAFVAGCGGTGTRTRTWTATDACGNTATCSRSIVVQDVTPPVITCAAQTSPVNCPGAPTFVAPTATDACSTVPPVITFVDAFVAGSCAGSGTLTRTWTATDACGNTATCSRSIVVQDVTGPVIICPANATAACNASTAPAATGTATATDACSTVPPVVTFTDVSTQGQGCSQFSYIIIRTWRATDACGNTATCSQTITVQDLVAPLITCPANVTRQCDQPTDPGSTGNATASGDNCAANNQLTVTFTDASSQTAAGCTNDSYVITRTWRAQDPCGNFSTCVQTITVVDNTPPTIICPPNVTVQCNVSTAPGATGTATGNAAANSVSWPDANTGLVGTSLANVAGIPAGAVITDVNVVLRMDHSWVGDLNMTLVSPSGATVNFIDNPCAGANSDNINATFDSQGAAHLCTTGVIADVGDPNGCSSDFLLGSAMNGTIQTQLGSFNTFNGSTMGNGNWQLQITDEVGGDGGCLIAYSVQVSWQTLTGGAVGIPTAVDNCSPLANIAFSFTDVSTQTATGCGNDNFVITRTWRATDVCGNFSTCVQTINVVDTTPPVITCPASVSIACTASTAPAATGTATATDACSATVAITSSDVTTQTAGGCSNDSYQIFRTWRATDACGNFSTCLQTITVSDTQAPVITCPAGQILSCFETVPAPFTTAADFIAGGGTITDNCTTNLADFTVFVQNVDNGNDNCPGNARVVTRTYFVQDACGNTTSCVQTFTYLASTTGPVITSILPTCFKFCASLANPMETDITFTTDCSFGAVVNITGPQQIGATNCPGTIYRYTYTVTDDCGRTSAPVTRDFIIGNDGPTITCPPFNLFLECGDENNAQYLEDHFGTVLVNTSCELGYTLTHTPQNFNNIACGSSTIVTFTATDACGRTSTCSTTVAIMDNTAPTIVSVPPSVCDITNCSADEVFWFNHWKNYMINGIVATDACDSDVNVTAVNTPLNTNCPNGTAVTVVTFVATDNCGNETEITGTFTVEATPSNLNILGKVVTEVQEGVESVEVTLAGSNIANQMVETGVDGIYGFNGLLAGDNYSVTPYSNDNPLNGVSSYDLVLISKHVLQTEFLDSPYKMIAADINRSGSITTLDMVELRKLILHIDEAFANNTSWRFVEAAFVFPQPNNPFATLFPEAVFINGLTESEQHDFVGVKVGDVNGSAVPNAFAGADDRTFVDDLVFQVKDQELKAGATYEVAFRADNFESVHGYQFTLNFDKQALTFAGLRAGDLTNMTESNFGTSLLEEGAITTSWTNQTAQSLTRDAAVFYVSFTANANVLLSEALAVSSRYTKAEAYDANLDLMDVKVRFNESEVATKDFRLYQNTPNPFKAETVIGFDLPADMFASLSIFDAAGRQLKLVEGDFVKGYNQVTISRNEFASSGLLYYQLVTAEFEQTKKMIVAE